MAEPLWCLEHVELDASSRAFSRREDLEAYHHLHRCRERFEADESLESLLPDVPRVGFDNDWLERRRGRLIYKLAYRLERQGECSTQAPCGFHSLSKHRLFTSLHQLIDLCFSN